MAPKKNGNKPVGFFPLFYNLAEAGRSVVVAKRFTEMGGNVKFFSHGGDYEYLAKDAGFSIISCKPQYTPQDIRRIISVNRGEQQGTAYPTSFLREAVHGEIQAFQQANIEMVVSFVNIPCSISARAAHLPLINVQPAYTKFHVSVPDAFDLPLFRYFPNKIKLSLLNYLFTHSKRLVKPFNIIAHEHHLPPFLTTFSIVKGDVTLGTDYLEFIQAFNNPPQLPKENYVGIIPLDELFTTNQPSPTLTEDISTHLTTNQHTILLTMGSSGDKQLILRLLQILNNLTYPVIAILGNIISPNELPPLNKHILIKDYVPSLPELHKHVDLSIIHGGQGTVYAAAYAGKPIIGIPMQFEQHLNLEKLVGHGTGHMLSRFHFTPKKFITTLTHIIQYYDHYQTAAETLAHNLPPPQGDINTAKRIMDLYHTHTNIQNRGD